MAEVQPQPQQQQGNRKDNDGLHKRRGVWHYKLKIAGKWKELSTHATNYQEARRVRQQALQDQEQGRLPNDLAKWRFERASAEWLAGRKNIVAPKTYSIDKDRMRPLLAFFSGQRLCDINADTVKAYQLKRAGKLSSRTINLKTKVLRMVLRTARLWSRISEDFKPLPENKQGPGRALTDEQEKCLFQTGASKPEWAVAYYAATLSANTTARAGEIKGLRLQDVDLLNRSLTIRRANTKTDAGARIIPLNERACWAVARLLERAAKIGSNEPDHYLLPACRYRRTKESQSNAGLGFDFTSPTHGWRTAWRTLTKKAGLPGLRFHDLRHHSITRLAEAGVPDQTLMAIAGHVSKAMLDHYSHVRMNAKRDAVGL
ncbi:MAG TPA: site-specific integrase [Bryobacteraceae bacterium]|jgi:integrase|nr:site-specific integrase [Bryobacteraceae bacterium]